MGKYFKTRKEWHNWLEKNHTIAEEIWIIYYKKSSGKPRIPYTAAVEEALCFGWIDGKIQSVNKDYYIQRFTPRRPGSRWSKYNIERVQKLIREDKMKPAGLKAYSKALDKPDLIYGNRSDGDPGIPDDLMNTLNKNDMAYKNFMGFSQTARRIYIEWLNSAKRSETRMRRILTIVDLAEKKIKPGISIRVKRV
jgi:uncharacterized protein YdeI (YjbR/CyaY-like superfamily)